MTSYLLGDHASELARLEFQATAWHDITVSVCRAAGIREGHRVVDLGCGPGFLTSTLASMVAPSGEVIAVERSGLFVSALRTRIETEQLAQVTVLEHDIARAPLPCTGIDVVVSRWLDPYIDDLDDLAAKELQCLRRGGRVVHFGTFHYAGVSMTPPCQAFDRVSARITDFYAQCGRRISATALLPAILSARGARIVSLFSASPVARPDEPLWEWYRQFSCSMVPRLREAGLVAEDVAHDYVALWDQQALAAGAFLSVPSHLAVIAEKP